MKLAAYLFLAFNVAFTLEGCKDKLQQTGPAVNKNYPIAEAFVGKNNDSAFYYFNEVTIHSTDSLEIARALNNMAAIQSDAGDYFGAQESLLSSLQFLKENTKRDAYCLSSDYNELGTVNLNLKNYVAAIDYYTRAISFVQDSNYKVVFINNLALAYQKTKDFTKALALYHQLLDKAKDDKKNYARVITNEATTSWLQDSSYYAAPVLWEALGIRRSLHDDWGINSSYGHLADYYLHSKPDSALFYAEALNASARKLDSPDDELEALEKIIALGSGNAVQAHFARYHYLNDSLQTARNNAKNQFALIRYESEKNKADNLKLQKDNTEKRLQIVWQQVSMFAILFLLIAGSWWGFKRYSSRRRKLLQDTENAIRTEKLKTSQKVHDVVANGLYRIMSEIEHEPEINKQQLLDNIESLYEQSRDISYEKERDSKLDYSKSIAGLLLSFDSPATRIMTLGNDTAVWKNIGTEKMEHVEHILQELMINMKKHSAAKNVLIKFERSTEQFNIDYRDDGIGLPSSFTYGNGLANTENRIKAIGGNIIFDTSYHKGLHVLLYFSVTAP